MSHEFHICHPSCDHGATLSCASCCGIYNYRGHDRRLVSDMLSMQTALMESWDGSDADMERVRAEAEARRPEPRFAVIYNCPFAGFLDAERSRVGCLLHPLVRGRDLREYCRYGHRTCGEARCTAYTYLTAAEAGAVAAAAPDWYLYGLCITDIDLVKDFFELCEMRLLGPVDPGRVTREPVLAAAFADYLALKENWPFATDPGRYGKYFFVGRDYHIYMIDYRKLGASFPHHDGILISLGSVIETRAELEGAVGIVDEKVDAFMEAYADAKSMARAG
ncbi:MAG TPA: hypothetical protein VM658_02650 [bacterium]|nr:hypothetical protein [bacterium]